MASSLKVSELISLPNPTSEDLFLIADIESASSRKLKFGDLVSALDSILSTTGTNTFDLVEEEKTLRETAISALQQKFDDLEQLNLNSGLSTGYLHVSQFTGA
jgi:hypothetical protein